MVLSVVMVVVSVAVTAGSACSGAAPVSSWLRAAPTGRKAAAAKVNRCLIRTLLERRDPARKRVSFAIVHVPRAASKSGLRLSYLQPVAIRYLEFGNSDRGCITVRLRHEDQLFNSSSSRNNSSASGLAIASALTTRRP